MALDVLLHLGVDVLELRPAVRMALPFFGLTVGLSLGPGKIGLGSFDETGTFKKIKITAKK